MATACAGFAAERARVMRDGSPSEKRRVPVESIIAAWTAWRFSITPFRSEMTKSLDRVVRMVFTFVFVGCRYG